jgi:DNA-binding MarR family transcriptional regulator
MAAHQTEGDRTNLFLSFVEVAVTRITRREPRVDEESMRLVLLLHRVTNSIIYDLVSAVHRPSGWSWGGFRLLFALWVLGPVDSKTVAAASGMSRPAVTALVRTLERDGMVQKLGDPHDGRSVVIALTGDGQDRLSEAFRRHTVREQRWSAALDDDEKSTLIALLMKLSNAAQDDWVRHR